MGYLPKPGVGFELIEFRSNGRDVQGGIFSPDPKLFKPSATAIVLVHGVESYPYVGRVPTNPRLGIPALILQDGPAGAAGGLTGVTAFPAPLTIAPSWDTDLMQHYGAAMATEVISKGANVVGHGAAVLLPVEQAAETGHRHRFGFEIHASPVQLLDANFDEVEEYPKVVGSRVSPTEQLDNVPLIGGSIQKGVLSKDINLENFVRKSLGILTISPEDFQRIVDRGLAPPNIGGRPTEVGEVDREEPRDDDLGRAVGLPDDEADLKEHRCGVTPQPKSAHPGPG